MEAFISRFTHHVLRFMLYAAILFQFGCSLTPIDPHDKKTAVEEAAITQATAEQALVSDNIRCIDAGPDRVWVGTDRGVSVYDKGDNRWTKLDFEDGLLSDDVTAIAVDGKFVWVGTGLGVSLYNIERKTWTKFQRRDGLASNKVIAITVDGNHIWFGTEAGISRYDKSTGAWALKSEKLSKAKSGDTEEKEKFNTVTAIAVDEEYVWFGTQEGLRRYDKAKEAWNTYTEEEGLVQNHIRCIALSQDAVWVGTEKSGVSKYSTTNQTFTESHSKTDLLESDFIEAIAVDGDNVWFGSADYGIRRYITVVDTWFKYTTAQGLVSDHITWLEIDGREIWIGTYEHGLGRYDKVKNTWRWYSKRDTLASNQITSLFSTDEAVWVGTIEGLSRYGFDTEAPTQPKDMRPKTWKTYTKADGLVTNYITCVTHDTDGETLWVGTPLGLGRMEGKRWRFYTERNGMVNNFVTCVNAFGDRVWAATKGGLSVLQLTIENPQQSISSYLEGKWVTAVLETGGEVWAGTTDGLYRRNTAKSEFESIPSVIDYVNTLAISPDGRLLVGTRNGLWVVDGVPKPLKGSNQRSMVHNQKANNQSRSLDPGLIHITDGLPNLNVRAIAADEDAIWVGTPGGGVRLQLTTESCQPTIQKIFKMQRDELLHDNIQGISVAREQVFFGTVAGLAVYHKETGQWAHHKPYYKTDILREAKVRWIELDGNYLWALHWADSPNGAILKFDRRTDTWVKYTKEALPLSTEVPFITYVPRLAVGADDVWFGTDGGVLRYNKSPDTWTHFTKSSGLPAHGVKFIEIDEHPHADGSEAETPSYRGHGNEGVWVSFHGGMAGYYNKGTGRWETLQVVEGGSGRPLEGIACTKNYVWFATENVGIRRYERATRTWRSYTEAQGLASRFGNWIAADGEEVWTGGWGSWSWVSDRDSGGVSRYRAADDTWLIYDRRKGLRARGNNYGQISEDYVWCFGWGGVDRYDKGDFSKQPD